MEENSLIIEGRNAVLEALKADRSIDRLLIIDSKNQDAPIKRIVAEARNKGIVVQFKSKDALDSIADNNKHQGVIAYIAAYDYVSIDDIIAKAKGKNEDPFVLILDKIEDPHNLGAIIRTANIAGVHGIIISKRRAVGLTATVAKTSAGAIEYTPIAKVTNISRAIEELQEKGLWIVCADMDGDMMYNVDLKGPIGLVVGNEGEGVSKLVKERCDLVAKIPMKGDIDSLNVSVATAVLVYEAYRQRNI